MIDKVLGSSRKAFKEVTAFLFVLGRTPKGPSVPDPAKAAAKRVREAMHAVRGNTGFSVGESTEKVLGKELRDGHKRP